MHFEWDESKNVSNFNKHGIRFEEARAIFSGIVCVSPDTRRNYGEERYIAVGALSKLAVLVVVYTVREEFIRIISARKANQRERELYYGHIEEED